MTAAHCQSLAVDSSSNPTIANMQFPQLALSMLSLSPEYPCISGTENLNASNGLVSSKPVSEHEQGPRPPSAIGQSQLKPVLPAFNTVLSSHFSGTQCVAVRCVTRGKLCDLVEKVEQYLKTASILPSLTHHVPLPNVGATSTSIVSRSNLMSGLHLHCQSSHASAACNHERTHTRILLFLYRGCASILQSTLPPNTPPSRLMPLHLPAQVAISPTKAL